jgi:DNA-binding transcriptional regulator YiaG
MITDEQKSKVAQLKAVIAAALTTREGAPQETRSAAVALKLEVKRSGTTARVLAAALGVHESTLSRWEREAGVSCAPAAAPVGKRRGASFRMVQVAATTTPVSVSPLAARGLRVAHTPSGLVIDGLDVETLAALLRRMS